MCEELRLERYDNSPWGFRLTGGLDFGTPLSIIKVTGGSIAEEAGVQAGDLVKNINGMPTTHFTHLDAQKCIEHSGNYLTLTVVRGSVVTPPVTPLRGLSPAPSYRTDDNDYIIHDSPSIMKTDIENEIMDYYNRQVDLRDGSRSPVPVYQIPAGQKATLTNNRNQYRVNDEGQLLLGDRALSDFEIAELLTSNEEVLDQGVLGINFKKFLPKVDFIRNSEVFKMLQSENTKKEISEQAQLQKEPNKRFSTFLMKPKAPKESPKPLTFVKFKPPRYLPKQPEKKWELPKLKPWERPKRKEPEHSVLWLFMEEKGEEIIDERWGTDEEERLNLSRNSFIEYDRSSMSSSLKMHEDDTCSIASKDQYDHESHLSKGEEKKYAEEHTAEKHSVDQDHLGESHAVTKKQKIAVESEETEHKHLERFSLDKVDMAEEKLQTEEYALQETSREERQRNELIINSRLVEQLAEIQNQISALENDAPLDLLTQLNAVKEQLSKIVQIKTSAQEVKKVEQIYEEEEIQEECSHSTQINTEHQFNKEQHRSENQWENEVQEKSSSVQEVKVQESKRSTSVQEKSYVEKSEFTEHKSEKHVEVSTYQVEELEETEFQLCIAPTPKPQKPKPKKKPSAHPITPQTRPIVLPGGRMWRQPKDAEHEEFYQGILVAQAEVLVGTTESLNYTKYMPPKVDMSTSEVYRLIHEAENTQKGASQKEDLEYCEPISKRHFYAATLREPPPIGVVELSDL